MSTDSIPRKYWKRAHSKRRTTRVKHAHSATPKYNYNSLATNANNVWNVRTSRCADSPLKTSLMRYPQPLENGPGQQNTLPPPSAKRKKSRKTHRHREQNSKAQRRPQKKQRGRYIDRKSLSRKWRSTFQRTYSIINTPRGKNSFQEINPQEAASKVLRWLKKKGFDPQL